jgi:Zn-dependent protease with chaperone function
MARALRHCFVLFAALSACDVAPREADIRFDPCQLLVLEPPADANPGQRQALRDAVALWQAVGVQRVAVADARLRSGQRLSVDFRKAAANFFGYYDGQRGRIAVNASLTDATARAVTLAHEVGHAWGLPHVPPTTRRSVMNPANLDVPPQPADAAAVWALVGGLCEGQR